MLIWAALYPARAYARIYQWTDSGGNVVFSDSPPSGVETKKIRRVKVNRNHAVVPRPPQKAREAAEDNFKPPALKDARDVSVILYETSWCPYCKEAKAYLRSAGVSLTEYDIEKDRARREEMERKTGSTSVPVIDVEGIIIRGYVPSAISAAILHKRQDRD